MFLAWYHDLKRGKACADCDGSYHPAAMEWDRVPGFDKAANVSRLLHTHSRRLVLAEIAKCELVCANCHAVRSWKRLRGVAQPG
jgi:hypothetical protein